MFAIGPPAPRPKLALNVSGRVESAAVLDYVCPNDVCLCLGIKKKQQLPDNIICINSANSYIRKVSITFILLVYISIPRNHQSSPMSLRSTKPRSPYPRAIH